VHHTLDTITKAMAECIHEVYEPRLEQVNIGTWFPDTRLISSTLLFPIELIPYEIEFTVGSSTVRYIH
jgi:hypothetical protein